jgi:Raf kinase inhibitor-like YbhB/YbcL family protein
MMRKLTLSMSLSVLLLGGAIAQAAAAGFTLTSPDIKPGSKIGEQFVFNSFGCNGPNMSPALTWSGAPPGTKSFVLTIYDPDAPTGSGFWHWVIYNIPASASGLPQGSGMPGKEPPGAVQSGNDFGTAGYGGPCPPKGAKPHHYVFTLYAEKTDKLEVPPNPTNAVIGFVTRAGAIAKTGFTAIYGH